MAKSYFIKERHNPQLGVYYVAEGQMTKKAAKSAEDNCVYGSVNMLEYKTETEYKDAIELLIEKGERIH